MQNTIEVSSALRETALLLEFANASKFKVQAYQRAAAVVTTVSDLGPLIEQSLLGDLEGIGPSLSRQIEELWNTGQSEHLNRLRRQLPPGASELVQVEGMTPRRLRALVDALGVRSVTELREACASGRVRGVRGFGQKTEETLRDACDRWLQRGDETPPPTLLSRALARAATLQRVLSEVVQRVEIVGAVRRGEETVRELELLVLGDPRPAVRALSDLRQVLRVDTGSDVLHLSEDLRLVVHGAEASGFGNALVLWTGSAAHVNLLGRRAMERGIPLVGWERDGREGPPLRAFEGEPALYAALGLSFVPPELRAGASELDEAAQGNFEDLVHTDDVTGMVHCHTSYSDGKDSVAEMARAAHALGMKYITITDHSPAARYANGVSLDRLKQQWDEIDQVQEGLPIRILKGIEADILVDGSLDFPDTILERFEVVIASIHARHRLDRSAMTSRLVSAMSLPLFKIWGHGLGRILNHREPIDCDVLAVLDALQASRGAIEINSDPIAWTCLRLGSQPLVNEGSPSSFRWMPIPHRGLAC